MKPHAVGPAFSAGLRSQRQAGELQLRRAARPAARAAGSARLPGRSCRRRRTVWRRWSPVRGVRWLFAGAVAALLSGAFAPAVLAAASGWSAPVSLPASGYPPLAVVNSAGAAAAIWYVQTPANTFAVDVASSPDGHTWLAAVTLDQGVEPAVALAPDGRAGAAWQGLSGPASLGVRASVQPPGGAWTAPVTVAPAGISPRLAVDGAGDAVALWTTSTSSTAAVQAAILPAGGRWSKPVTLGTGTGASLAVNPAGAIVAAWVAGRGTIMTSAGTVGTGWSAPVSLGTGYHPHGLHVALGADGQAIAAWSANSSVTAATRGPGGAWTAPATVAAGSSVGVAQDGMGDAVLLLVQTTPNGLSQTYSLYAVRHSPAGGWATPTLLSAGATVSGSVAATPAGSFVVAYDGSAVTSPPGQGFGAPVTVVPGGSTVLVTAAPGHALALWNTGPGSPSQVLAATEPVS